MQWQVGRAEVGREGQGLGSEQAVVPLRSSRCGAA